MSNAGGPQAKPGAGGPEPSPGANRGALGTGPSPGPSPGAGSLRGLDLAVLGVLAGVFTGLAWLSGLAYLLVRGGLPSPVQLAAVDAVHLYVGIGAIVILATKTGRAGWRLRVPGEVETAPRRRWLSWSLVALYAGVALTGGLALLPLPGGAQAAMVDAHLIAAVWATVPTTAHLLVYRRRAVAVMRPPSGSRRRRRLLGLICAMAPLAAVAAVPRSISSLARVGAGAGWSPDGPQVFLDRLAAAPGGRSLVAGGSGLFVAPVVGPPGGRQPARVPGAWTGVGTFDADNPVLGLDLPDQGPVAAWVGAGDGLWAAPRLRGPYRRVPLPSEVVHAIAVAPGAPALVWASSGDGFWRSTDGGRHWHRADAGVASPSTSWAVAFSGSQLYGSDQDAVYRWTGRRWAAVSHQAGVVMLDRGPGGRLFASSMGYGIRVLGQGGWRPAQGGLRVHDHGALPGIHVVSVSALGDGRAYAGTMDEGAVASLDGGRSWSQAWPQLGGGGVVWRVLPLAGPAGSPGSLVAATDHGIFAYRLPGDRAPSASWWVGVIGLALLAPGLAAGVAASPPRSRAA